MSSFLSLMENRNHFDDVLRNIVQAYSGTFVFENNVFSY